MTPWALGMPSKADKYQKIGANCTSGILDKERIIAGPGFDRWLVPPAALAIYLCIEIAYGF